MGTMRVTTLSSILLLLDQTMQVTPFAVTHIHRHDRIRQTWKQGHVGRSMGLYDDDEPLPDLPRDNTKGRVTRADIRSQPRKITNLNDYLPEEKDDFGGILPDFDTESTVDLEDQRSNLFDFDPIGTERNGRLPDLKRTLYDEIPCYFERGDKKSLLIVEKTECSSQDACWALEAHEGDIVKTILSIAMAQRLVLNESVSLPSKEEVANTDWDEELRSLNKSGNVKGLGEEFENAGRSIGMDGLQERKESLRKKGMVDNVKRIFEEGTKDQKWMPGKANPNPVDDEPWFTG